MKTQKEMFNRMNEIEHELCGDDDQFIEMLDEFIHLYNKLKKRKIK